MRNVICGRCVKCGKEYPATPDLTNCECGGILDIIYDYDYIKSVLTKEKLAARRNPTMWRYRELLPIEEDTPDTPLRVGWSPLYEAERLAKILGIRKLWIKDDGINPTASLKDRASAMAVAGGPSDSSAIRGPDICPLNGPFFRQSFDSIHTRQNRTRECEMPPASALSAGIIAVKKRKAE